MGAVARRRWWIVVGGVTWSLITADGGVICWCFYFFEWCVACDCGLIPIVLWSGGASPHAAGPWWFSRFGRAKRRVVGLRFV